jgi:hypothetical protein
LFYYPKDESTELAYNAEEDEHEGQDDNDQLYEEEWLKQIAATSTTNEKKR